MKQGAWLVALVKERLVRPFAFPRRTQLRTAHRTISFQNGLTKEDERLVGFLVGNDLVATWTLGARAVLYSLSSHSVALTSEVIAFRDEDEKASPEAFVANETSAAIPVAKLLREEQKKRVRPPSYSAPDLGSCARIDLTSPNLQTSDSQSNEDPLSSTGS